MLRRVMKVEVRGSVRDRLEHRYRNVSRLLRGCVSNMLGNGFGNLVFPDPILARHTA